MTQNIMQATSALPKLLVSQTITSASGQTVYTVPALTATKLAKATITNQFSATAVTVGVELVKSGGTAGQAHWVIPNTFTLAGSDWKDLTELVGHFLGPGDFINVNAGTANAITFVMSGVEFS